jgi:hypothetical protein
MALKGCFADDGYELNTLCCPLIILGMYIVCL